MWQVRCNDGGPHDFGPSDMPEEAMCSVCRMSKNEIKKRILVNRLIRLFNSDPYTKCVDDMLKARLEKAIRILDKLEMNTTKVGK